MVKQELSEYEQTRLRNIAERDALLKNLNLEAAGKGLAISVKPKSTSTAARAKRKSVGATKVKNEEIVPRRTSSRIAGIEADSEVAKRKAETEYEQAQEAQRAKRQRISGDLNLSDIVVVGKEWNKDLFGGVINRGAKPYERTFGDAEVRETTDKELKALRERMSALELYEGFEPNRIKITPERIYSMAFHPEVSKPLVFAGDKLGNLGIFDASQSSNLASATKPLKAGGLSDNDEDDAGEDEGPEPSITGLHIHTRTISAFQFSPLNASHLLTASYDSSLRLLDLTSSVSREVYGPNDTLADEPLSGVECDPSSPHVLYFSRLDGYIGRCDMREDSKTVAVAWELSEKKIGGFSLHPSRPHFLATASLDRTMKIWDLRKMEGKGAGQKPHCVGEHTSRLSVSHAAFNSAGQVATASYDDTVKVYSWPGMGEWKSGKVLGEEEMEPEVVVRHNNQTGRWVTM
jgi:WD40 repeat protein